jgi:hypothetical protein
MSDIGYGKPPKHTQFKPGQSGNPKGRPRKRKTLAEEVERELRTVVVLQENGNARRMSKCQMIALQHVNRAATGNVRSTELLLKVRQQGQAGQHDNLNSLLEEFREKNRRLQDDHDKKENDPAATLDAGVSDPATDDES